MIEVYPGYENSLEKKKNTLNVRQDLIIGICMKLDLYLINTFSPDSRAKFINSIH